MSDAKLKIKVAEKTFIKKYSEGVDPKTGEPFEVVESKDVIYEGQEAIDKLKEYGYDTTQLI